MAVSNTQNLPGRILAWYFAAEPLSIIRGYASYARALLEIIPLLFLAFTLLSPWKNIRERKTEHGFNLERAFERLILNVLSRIVGAVVRILAIAIGILLHIALFAFAVTYLVLWLLLPAITLTALAVLPRTL